MADDFPQSYLVRWVNVKEDHTISWSIQAHKKSINFGIFKHPGHGIAPTPRFPSSTFEPPPTPGLNPSDPPQEQTPTNAHNASSTAAEKLKGIGLKLISWYGTCEANRITSGTYDVLKDQGGMYALVFDNTFAKQFSKTATCVLLTFPTYSPPQSNHQAHHIQGSSAGSATNLRESGISYGNDSDTVRYSRQPSITFHRLESSDAASRRPKSTSISTITTPGLPKRDNLGNGTSGSNFFTGLLQKRRRKRHQGYARRFFSLDFTTCTLSYYHNRNTLALRGAIPLSLAVISTDPTLKQISIDSGAEIWHLKANNVKDFEAWVQALEKATATSTPTLTTPNIGPKSRIKRQPTTTRLTHEDEKDWVRLGDLLKRVESSRDSALSIAKDTDPKYVSLSSLRISASKNLGQQMPDASSMARSPSDPHENDYERRPFWKRRTASERSVPGTFKRSASAQPSASSSTNNLNAKLASPTNPSAAEGPQLPQEEILHDHCMSLLKNLDTIAEDFSRLLADHKLRRRAPEAVETSRHSLDSVGSQEFFDAEVGSQLVSIQHESEEDDAARISEAHESDSSSASDVVGGIRQDNGTSVLSQVKAGFPAKAKSLNPLPTPRVNRRTHIEPPLVQPPSLIGFLRKNVGKDFSTISMPVSANEPLSLLQRAAEQLEYSTLLDEAAKAPSSSRRLAYVAAFAISTLSIARSKERAIRKPFNPMLGETFELVREDRGFRFLSEKVSHRPVRMALQAESKDWAFTQSPMPTQKFWGKSAELITEGRVRVVLHQSGDRFSWAPANSFLRNIIAGEKYVEPVGSMTIVNESTGEQAVATFKAKGMFSGRSEDVSVQLSDSYGDALSLGLVGKWTSSLSFTEGDQLHSQESPLWAVTDASHDMSCGYGLTSFAASLNEITVLERGRLPPTDSRLRPDQRALEQGDLDNAEQLKVELEEAQRRRRREMEENGREWEPRWFERVSGHGEEEIWQLKKDNYWDTRTKGGSWEDVEKLFEGQ